MTNISMRHGHFFLIIAFIILLLVPPASVSAQTPVASGLSYSEFLVDINPRTGNFTTYDPGDTIEVEDKIIRVKYSEDEDITELWLESTGLSSKRPQYLIFYSDLSTAYRVGEEIRVEFTIFLNENTGREDYDYSKESLSHITFIEPEDDHKGLDILGYHLDLPPHLDNAYGKFLLYFCIWLIIAFIIVIIEDTILKQIVHKRIIGTGPLKEIRISVLILIILFGLVNSVSALELPENVEFWITQIYNIGLFLTIVWLVYRVINLILIHFSMSISKQKEHKFEKVLIPLFRKIIGLFIFIFALFMILGYLGIDLTALAVGGVVLSMVIAFAAQDTLSNYFSGMFLIAEPDFKEHDMVMLEDRVYEVRHVGVRNSKLYDTKEHMIVLVPNNMLANNKIVNLSEPDEKMRLFVDIGVAYGSDTEKVKKILLDIAAKHPRILKQPAAFAPEVRFREFGDSSLNFQLVAWIDDIEERFRIRTDVNYEIDRMFRKEGVTIPFPQRDVHIKEK
jgi:small-conductance mechanosensitive channel